MVQRREELGLTLEPRQALFVSRELFGKNFDRYVAVELPIACPIDLTRYTQIVFESQRNTNFVFNRSKKGSAPCGKVEKEDDGKYLKEPELAPEVILTELRTVVGK